MELGIGPGRRLCVRWGPRSPFPKGGLSPLPNFRPILLWPNGWMDQDGTWHGARPRPRRLCVRWGPSCPLSKRGRSPPQFSAHFYYGQTAGWIKMALGMELGLGPGDFVLDGDPAAPSPKRGKGGVPKICTVVIVYSSLSSTALCILFLEKKAESYSACSNINTESNIYYASGVNGSGREAYLHLIHR